MAVWQRVKSVGVSIGARRMMVRQVASQVARPGHGRPGRRHSDRHVAKGSAPPKQGILRQRPPSLSSASSLLPPPCSPARCCTAAAHNRHNAQVNMTLLRPSRQSEARGGTCISQQAETGVTAILSYMIHDVRTSTGGGDGTRTSAMQQQATWCLAARTNGSMASAVLCGKQVTKTQASRIRQSDTSGGSHHAGHWARPGLLRVDDGGTNHGLRTAWSGCSRLLRSTALLPRVLCGRQLYLSSCAPGQRVGGGQSPVTSGHWPLPMGGMEGMEVRGQGGRKNPCCPTRMTLEVGGQQEPKSPGAAIACRSLFAIQPRPLLAQKSAPSRAGTQPSNPPSSCLPSFLFASH